jgi:hypothetical protein
VIVYESDYKELSFFVNKIPFKFRNGSYTTDNEEVIKVLDKSPYTKRVGEAETVKAPIKRKAPKKAE